MAVKLYIRQIPRVLHRTASRLSPVLRCMVIGLGLRAPLGNSDRILTPVALGQRKLVYEPSGARTFKFASTPLDGASTEC